MPIPTLAEKHIHYSFLPAPHLEILEDIGISLPSLEIQSPQAWKSLIEAKDLQLNSLPAFVTRKRRHDFYYRHEGIIEHLISNYSNKV